RARERRERPAVEIDPIAGQLGEPRLDPRRLGPGDPLSDHERGRRLVRRVEADRSEVTMVALESADDRVPLTDGGPAGPVAIERDRPERLGERGARVAGRDEPDPD